jgi:hypothetical protein
MQPNWKLIRKKPLCVEVVLIELLGGKVFARFKKEPYDGHRFTVAVRSEFAGQMEKYGISSVEEFVEGVHGRYELTGHDILESADWWKRHGMPLKDG